MNSIEEESGKLKRVSATYATKHTSDLLGRVHHGKEIIIIEVHDKPRVAMLPYEEYAASANILLSEKDRNLFLKALDHPPAPSKALKKAIKKFQRKAL
jgi:antitoxin (DNA-binding transcriptional repressor) of toxin-antitoxin stability system